MAGVVGMINAGKGAIFDLDGTLLDSTHVWDDVDRISLARRGIALPDDYIPTVASMHFRQVADYTIARFSLPDTPERLLAEWNALARYAYAHTVRAKPHAVRYVRYLVRTGARLAVATTLPPELSAPALQHVGLAEFFDTVVSVGEIGNVGKGKPDIYLTAARRIGVMPSWCTVFEDVLDAVRGAKDAGMRVWAVADDSSTSQWGEIRIEADGTLHDFSTAPRVL